MQKKKILTIKEAARLIDDKKINEPKFCAAFLENHALRCINGRFIGYDGVVDDSIIETEIQ